jgi:hypothetical protein
MTLWRTGGSIDRVLIRVWVQEQRPLSGYLITAADRPRSFIGWVGLLRALSDVLLPSADDGPQRSAIESG